MGPMQGSWTRTCSLPQNCVGKSIKIFWYVAMLNVKMASFFQSGSFGVQVTS